MLRTITPDRVKAGPLKEPFFLIMKEDSNIYLAIKSWDGSALSFHVISELVSLPSNVLKSLSAAELGTTIDPFTTFMDSYHPQAPHQAFSVRMGVDTAAPQEETVEVSNPYPTPRQPWTLGADHPLGTIENIEHRDGQTYATVVASPEWYFHPLL